VDPINKMILPLGLSYLVFTVLSSQIEIKRQTIQPENHFGYFFKVKGSRFKVPRTSTMNLQPETWNLPAKQTVMKTIKFIIYKEGKYYVSQCLNVDVASFGNTMDEAAASLKEALDLYFADEPARLNYRKIDETLMGELQLRF
jgi:predicted RNase H-like HicB family nuclease